MTLKDQFTKIKENWLLLVLILIVLVFLNVFQGGYFPLISEGFTAAKMIAVSTSPSGLGYGVKYPLYEDFAPDVKERKITKSSSISIEVETGSFKSAESKLKSILKSTGSYLLNENVNVYGSGWKEYYTGSYQIKVDTKKYSDVVAQLKGIGEVKSFNENSEDITATYKNLEIELNAEKQRLERYNKMYQEAQLIADKIQLNDRIFEQERNIKYIEDSLKNIDKRVDYSTIYVVLNEKQPKYINIKFIEFSELVERLVDSINSLLKLIFVTLPYAIAGIIVWIIIKFFKNKKAK